MPDVIAGYVRAAARPTTSPTAARQPAGRPSLRLSAGGVLRRSTFLLTAAALALLAGACGEADGGGGPGEAVTVRDSAGIQIVENRAPAWGETEVWAVADTPSLTLGEAQGEGPEVFGSVREALLLSEGGVAVLDGQAREIRIFGPDGDHRATAGGAGEGPGELNGLPRLVDLAGDTVGVWVEQSKRMSRFDPDGAFVDAVTVDGLPGMVNFQVRGALDDGRFLVSEGMSFSPDDMDRGPGIHRDTLSEFLVGRDGALADTLGRFPGRERAGSLRDMKVVFFSRSTHFAVGEGRIHVGDSERWEVRVFDDSLREKMRIRRPHEPVHLSDEAVETHRQEQLDQFGDADARFRENILDQIRNAVARKTLPAFGEIAVDAAGHLWVERARLPTAAGPPRWDVFRPDGRWLGAVVTPEDLTIYRIGTDRLVGRRTDELGVGRVEVYSIRKP